LSEEIKKKGIINERTAHHVGRKVNKMEAEYRKCNDWVNQTGQGFLDEGRDITDARNKCCSFFYTLEPMMQNRPGTNPLILSGIGVGDEAEEPEGNDDDSSTTEQLHGTDISVMVVDDSPEKKTLAENSTTGSADANNNNK
jgi:hypothetical protein